MKKKLINYLQKNPRKIEKQVNLQIRIIKL